MRFGTDMKTIPKSKLTKAFLQDYADQQIAKYLAVGPVDEELAQQHLTEAYRVAKLEPPKHFIWFDSPTAFSVWDSVGDSVGASVRASVWASVRASVGASVWAWGSAGYDSWLKYFNDQMEENDFRHVCLFDEMVNGYFLTADTAYIVRKPIFLARDEQGRLHNDQRKAIEWADGTGFYYLHGQEFDEKLFKKVTSPKFNLKQLMEIENSDQRTEAWRILKPSEVLKGMKAKLLDTGQRGTRLYQVDNFMDTGSTEYCIVMDDSSTDRQFLEWVEPEIGKQKNAELCQAHAFGIPLEDWLLMEQEA